MTTATSSHFIVPATTNPTTSTTSDTTVIATIPFNLPNAIPIQERAKARRFTAHLSSNLVQISISGAAAVCEPLMNKATVLQLCGAYYKHVRSMYICNGLEALVDFVPKDSTTIDTVLDFSGVKYIQKHKVYIGYHKAINRVPLGLIGDYAAMLAWAQTANKGMDEKYFYPNENWELPVYMVPIVLLPAGSYDSEVSANNIRETTITVQATVKPPKRIP